jgi:hypothetical protein
LEAHVTQRINELLCSLQVLERATQRPARDALDFEPYGGVEPAAGDRKPWRRPVRGNARGGVPV